MADGSKAHAEGGPRKVNECIMSLKQAAPLAMLFDEFWREGELALLFGERGTGKSILAVQVADALAQGCPIDGFRMTTIRRRVLYVDLNLSDRQFRTRYSIAPNENGRASVCRFSENLYRGQPPAGKQLDEWLRATVHEHGFSVVVIDDISAIRRTHEGTRETLAVMRQLKRLKEELNLSVLVLSDAHEPRGGQSVSERDLGRSVVLCNAADSVFAIGFRACPGPGRYLIQTRLKSATIFWTPSNGPICHVERYDDGLLAFRFDQRFTSQMDEELRQMVWKVKRLRDKGASYRRIGEELGIWPSKVVRLLRKWTPDLEPPKEIEEEVDNQREPSQVSLKLDQSDDFSDDQDSEDDDDNQWEPPQEDLKLDQSDDFPDGQDSEDDDDNQWEPPQEDLKLDQSGDFPDHQESGEEPDLTFPDLPPEPSSTDAAREEWKAIDPLAHLEPSFDGTGTEIFVECRDHSGKPAVWYTFNTKEGERTGKMTRWERRFDGPSGTHVDGPICWFNTRYPMRE